MFVRFTATLRHPGGTWTKAPFSTVDAAREWSDSRVTQGQFPVDVVEVVHARTGKLRLLWRRGQWVDVSRWT
jgi:hypothetical protein